MMGKWSDHAVFNFYSNHWGIVIWIQKMEKVKNYSKIPIWQPLHTPFILGNVFF